MREERLESDLYSKQQVGNNKISLAMCDHVY